MTTTKNLSEKLFKPQFKYPETSSLVNRTESLTNASKSQLDKAFSTHWYRVVDLLQWHWRGLSIIEIEAVLASIAASNKERSNPELLDTVIGYQSGNWIYEFLQQSAEWQQKAEELKKGEDNNEKCFEAWLNASLFASLASYPHYRNDDLANQAQTFATRLYHEAMALSPYTIKDVEFKIENKPIKAILHTPIKKGEQPKTFPIVLLCAGLTNLEIDYYNFFANYLAPNGFGLLTVDSPSIGTSKQFNLRQNTSIIHQSVLEQIKTIPAIDYANVFLMGVQFGANIATRLAYLMPNKIRGLINIRPLIHQMYVETELQQKLPDMYKDLLADRLGVCKISDHALAAELKFLSLKEQCLITKPCHTPLLSIHFEGDIMSSEKEAKLLTSNKKNTYINVKKSDFKNNARACAAKEVINWMKVLLQ
ncbi:alpha/beta hydrolase [Orbaceae bacterium ac157xtp]